MYTFVAFAGATFLYPLHVPGGAFIHTAIGLQPHAAILSMEGVLLLVGWLAGRRRQLGAGHGRRRSSSGASPRSSSRRAVIFTQPVHAGWDATRQPRIGAGGRTSSGSA